MDRGVNEIEPAGQSAQPIGGEIESGQPAGGPNDLGQKAHEAIGEFETQDAMGAGIDAFAQGLRRDDCPYPAESEHAKQWEQGWDRQRLTARL